MNYVLFSERCSGSNIVEATINKNLPMLEKCSDYGFKHWLEEEFLNEKTFPPGMIFIILMRSPFDWLRSIYRQPWHCAYHLRNMGFSEFIRAEWECVWDAQALIPEDDPRWMTEMMFERNPLNEGRRFRNILEVRRVKHTLWRDRLSSQPSTYRISYEAFTASPEVALNQIASHHGLQAPRSVRISKGYKGKSSLTWKRKLAWLLSCGHWGSYEYKPIAKKPIALDDIDFILGELDKSLEKDWSYDIEAIAESERNFTLGYQASASN